jgi:hypothetical protein
MCASEQVRSVVSHEAFVSVTRFTGSGPKKSGTTLVRKGGGLRLTITVHHHPVSVVGTGTASANSRNASRERCPSAMSSFELLCGGRPGRRLRLAALEFLVPLARPRGSHGVLRASFGVRSARALRSVYGRFRSPGGQDPGRADNAARHDQGPRRQTWERCRPGRRLFWL